MAVKVLKFGGSSVGSEEGLQNVIEIVSAEVKNTRQLVVVVSALKGVTDSLIKMARLAARGDSSYMTTLGEIAKRHEQVLKANVPVDEQGPALSELNSLMGNLGDLLHGVMLVEDISAKVLDPIAGMGERLCAAVLTAILSSKVTPFKLLDTSALIVTDSNYGNAQVDIKATYANIENKISQHEGPFLATGYIAADKNGNRTTLGRGGSDYTAALFGAAAGTEEVQIWTDVDGVLSADPKKVKKAVPVSHLTYEEAMELSHFGAKVIYPPTLYPLFKKRIPVRILNTFKREHPGSSISFDVPDTPHAITGISSIDPVAVLTLIGSGMVGVAGVSQRLFGALSRENISVILISQASSEHSICFAIPPESVEAARSAIESEFEFEMSRGVIHPLMVEPESSILAIVGRNMRHSPGVAGKLFQALGKNGINVKAIAQGSSELNISVVVERGDSAKALRVVHDAFFLSESTTINIFLAGVGNVGSELLKQLKEHTATLRREQKLEVKLAGIANSKEFVIDTENGIGIDDWKSSLTKNSGSVAFDSYVKEIIEANLPNSIFVDCTASDVVAGCYKSLLSKAISVITPNKRANSSSYEAYLGLKNAAKKANVKYYYETNVGAGLPVINTLQDLLSSGDRVQRIEGVLSGTLSYIFNSLDGKRTFSDIVSEAKAKGYTEPDPRDDLSGTDVARKILILARETGLALEESEIEVESLIPENCKTAANAEEFLERLPESDGDFQKRLAKASNAGKKLRYIAKLENGKAKVAVTEVDAEHPFYNLSGSDNVISFVTERYSECPLVVKGPGAGTEVTAAGVFADIVRTATYLQ